MIFVNGKFVIPHFHYDYLWIDTPDKMGAKTARLIRKGLKRIRRSEKYKFVIDSVMALKYFRLHYPEMWDELKRRVKEKRVDLIGGMIVSLDTYLPNTETLIRQILYGKKYIKENFGVESNIGYLIDSFGHTAQLPQILRKSGYSYFMFMRGGRDLPQDFTWEGLDGTRITNHNLKRYYNLTSFNKSGLILKGMDNYLSNHFGKCSLPIDYFNYMRGKKLPIIKGELKNEFDGTYSSRIRLKQKIKELENKYYTAELLSTLTKTYPLSLERTITRILCCCFHDGITGTHTDKVSDVMWKMLRKSEKELESTINNSLKKLSKNVSIAEEFEKYIPLLVFNPLSVKRTETASFEFVHPFFVIRNENGEITPHQKDYFSDYKYVFMAEEVPSIGYKVYYIDETNTQKIPISEDCELIGNELIKIDAEKNKGDVYRINKRKGKKYKQKTKRGAIVDDGLVRTISKFESKIRNSTITQYTIINHNNCLKRDILLIIDNKDKNNYIRAVFDRPKTILTKGLTDFKITKDKIYLTLLRGVGTMSKLRKPLSFPFRIPKAQELGKHIFEFSILNGNYNRFIENLKHNNPLIARTFKPSKKAKDSDYRCMMYVIPNKDVVITSVKKAENDSDMIIRVLNTTDKKRNASLSFDFEIKNVSLVDLLEKPIRQMIAVYSKSAFFVIKPHEILTIKVKK